MSTRFIALSSSWLVWAGNVQCRTRKAVLNGQTSVSQLLISSYDIGQNALSVGNESPVEQGSRKRRGAMWSCVSDVTAPSGAVGGLSSALFYGAGQLRWLQVSYPERVCAWLSSSYRKKEDGEFLEISTFALKRLGSFCLDVRRLNSDLSQKRPISYSLFIIQRLYWKS